VYLREFSIGDFRILGLAHALFLFSPRASSGIQYMTDDSATEFGGDS
jgi:hypothetical protein